MGLSPVGTGAPSTERVAREAASHIGIQRIFVSGYSRGADAATLMVLGHNWVESIRKCLSQWPLLTVE